MVLEQRAAWSELCELRPDPWFRVGYRLVTRGVRATWSQYVNAAEEDLVLVENTSSGINSILRTFPFASGDNVLVLDLAYDMVVHTLDYVAKRSNLTVLTVTTDFPFVDADSFLTPLQRTIDAAPDGVRMCIFSHITTVPSVIVPIAELASACAAIGAVVVIDGAHAVGQIPVDLSALHAAGVDFYVANGHKWLYGPPGTAMLWVSPTYQSLVVPAVLSATTGFVSEYEYIGTRDYTAWASLNATFNFRAWLGEERVTGYIKTLADTGAAYLADLFGTDLAAPPSMTHALTNVGLPTTNLTLAQSMQATILASHDMYLVPFEHPTGVFWLRISNQIYLDMDDYKLLGEVVLDYLGIEPAHGGRGTRWHRQTETMRRHRRQQRRHTDVWALQ